MAFLFSKVPVVTATSEPASKSVDNEDVGLVERLKNGDIRAFDILVKKYQRRLYSVIYNLTSNKEDTADLIQEVFLKAFNSIHSFKGEAAFYTWIYRIALNASITFVKKQRKNTFYSLENLNESAKKIEFLDALAEKTHTDKNVLLKELQEKLNEALQKLSLNHRTVVVLFEIEGMSHMEIAKILKCSEGTVRSRLHYAKEQLKQLLSGYLK